MNTKITRIKVWVEKGETRIYVNTSEGHDGCRYVTGNKWHTKGSTDGTVTAEEWKEARALACTAGKWSSWYAPRETATTRATTSRATFTASEDTREELEAAREWFGRQRATGIDDSEQVLF